MHAVAVSQAPNASVLSCRLAAPEATLAIADKRPMRIPACCDA